MVIFIRVLKINFLGEHMKVNFVIYNLVLMEKL
jgi:hypothetical protein